MAHCAGASARPTMVNRSWTPPSGVTPSGMKVKRASRAGPLGRMNEGMLFVAPSASPAAISGFAAGVVPPEAGCEWQLRQLFELNLGPRPLRALGAELVTVATSLKNA